MEKKSHKTSKTYHFKIDKLVHLLKLLKEISSSKRMFAYTGNKVVKLHRLEFVGFRVDDLKEGVI